MQQEHQNYISELKSSEFGDIGKRENPYEPQVIIPGGAITADEMVQASKRLKKNKGTGPDGVTNEALIATMVILSNIWAAFLNILILRGL